jgi:glycosyltransferase involved in cell wall biosynthesis
VRLRGRHGGTETLLFLTQYDERGASSRCRVYQYLPHLAARGIESEVIPRLPSMAELWRQARAVDGVFLQKRVPSLPRLLALRRARRLWFDFDDAIWLRREADGRVRRATARKRLRLAATLRLADGVVAGNEYLAAYARRWSRRVDVLPTPIDLDYYRSSHRIADSGQQSAGGEEELIGAGAKGGGTGVRALDHEHEQSPTPNTQHPTPTLGWVGHPDNLCYLQRLEPAFAALARRFSGLTLRVVCSEPFRSEAIRVENVPWSLEEEIANLRSFEIGLMPLEDDAWTQGKCGYKALQYMAVGVPVVCSPVGMNRDIVKEAENGLLAVEPADWERQLARLIESSELRQRLGAAGRRSVEQHYSLTVMAERLAGLLMG